MRALAVLLLLATACTAVGEGDVAGPADPPSSPPTGAPSSAPDADVATIRVASGPDAETALLAHTLAALLVRGGLDAEVVPFSDARDARQALELGRVDVRPAYTGEAWLETLGRPDPPSDGLESYLAVSEHDRDQGIAWLRPRFAEGVDSPPANATFAFVVAGPPSIDADLATVSHLAARLSERPDATLCVDQEFVSRSDGLRAVLAAYSVRSDQPVLAATPEEAVLGVSAGDCLAGLTTATDGAAWRAGLRPLVDDLGVFPAFVPLPQVRDDAAEEHRSLRSSIGPLPAQLTTELLAAANARVQDDDSLEVVGDDLAVELLRRAGRPVTPPIPRT
jgi:osmoprotectant transport system substrate-binding protein